MKVLFGAGRAGRLSLQRLGKKNVRLFIDNYSNQNMIEGVPVIRFDDYINSKLDSSDEIIIALGGEKEEAKQLLDSKGLKYNYFDDINIDQDIGKGLHIYGIYPDIQMEIGKEVVEEDLKYRALLTSELIRETLRTNNSLFSSKVIDLYVYLGDQPTDAYNYMKEHHLKHVFAYSTVYSYEDSVIPIPDYRCYYIEKPYYYYEDIEESLKARNTEINDQRIHWRGSLWTNKERNWIVRLGEKSPDILNVEVYNGKTYKPMTEYTNFKYVLDIRGFSSTDRLKNLLWLLRPVFLVYRPSKEWYYDLMEPMKHYIPVKEDLSDLLEQYRYMQNHPEKYNEMQEAMKDFCENVLSPEKICEYTKNIILKYGIVE